MSRLVSRPVVAWLTLLTIAGTLCACGRYGPPKRSPTDGAAAGAASDSAVPASPTSDDDGKRRDERDN